MKGGESWTSKVNASCNNDITIKCVLKNGVEIKYVHKMLLIRCTFIKVQPSCGNCGCWL